MNAPAAPFKKALLHACVAAAALGAFQASAIAGNHGKYLTVYTQVRPSGAFRVDVRAAQLQVSEADIARGYVDVPLGSVISIDSGRVLPAVLVDFTPLMGVFKSVQLRADYSWRVAERGPDLLNVAALESLPPTAAAKPMSPARPHLLEKFVTESRTPPGATVTGLSYRFNLVDKVMPGRYPVPLTVNVDL